MPELRSVLGGSTLTNLGQGAALVRGAGDEHFVYIPMQGIEDYSLFDKALKHERVWIDHEEECIGYLESHIIMRAWPYEDDEVIT